MKKIREAPIEGLVIRYDYLWKRESIYGRSEGSKTRPCAVVVSLALDLKGRQRVLLAPITHSVPNNVDEAIEISPSIKRRLGLDESRSWIVVNEINVADWQDPGFEPVVKGKWSYGLLPESLMLKVRKIILEHAEKKTLKQVNRPTKD